MSGTRDAERHGLRWDGAPEGMLCYLRPSPCAVCGGPVLVVDDIGTSMIPEGLCPCGDGHARAGRLVEMIQALGWLSWPWNNSDHAPEGVTA